jgi:hypothetical protein
MEGTHTAERQTTYGPSQTLQKPAPGQPHDTTRLPWVGGCGDALRV